MQQHNCTIYCPPNCPFVPQYCIPECEDGQNCVETLVSDCIVYEGTYLEQYGVEPGTSLTGVIIHLANLVYPDCAPTTTTTTTEPLGCTCFTVDWLSGSHIATYDSCETRESVSSPVNQQNPSLTICAVINSLSVVSVDPGEVDIQPGETCLADGDCPTTTTTTLPPVASRCVFLYSPSTASSFDNNPSIERHFGQVNRFTLVDFTFNGVQYATGQTIIVKSVFGGPGDPGDPIVYGLGLDGSTYIMNVSDWMNSIGVSGITFHDNLSVIDLDDDTSTYTIQILKSWEDNPSVTPGTGGVPYWITSQYGLAVTWSTPSNTYGYRSCTTI